MEQIADRNVMLDVMDIKGKSVLELGVFKGEYSAEILKRQPYELILVDPWKAQPSMRYYDEANSSQEDFDKIRWEVYQKYGERPNVHIEQGYSHEIAGKVKNECLDLVFIDGNHSFGHCFYDLAAWSSKVKKGGFVAVHDFGGGSIFFGVRQAVNEFCKVTGNEIWGVTEDLWGCAILKLK